MNSVVLYGIRTDYVHEVSEILDSIGLEAELWDNRDDSQDFAQLEGRPFLLAAGSPSGRMELDSEARSLKMKPHPAIVHQSASVSPSASLGPGTTVNRLVAIGSRAKIGSHVQVNRSVSIGHGARVGNFVSFGAAVVLAGNVTIESAAFLGAGSVVLPGLKVGKGAMVGAGAVVTRDVPAGRTVVGVPARLI